eukprot:gb/GECG01000734.1/.p1 GENE.gb/GECG01000734.1/~~gb/GECG01000734.1/.p1  ORF type:complete len:103 (+),score=8.98 gb/GECG01000734.1/:1-309(+)
MYVLQLMKTKIRTRGRKLVSLSAILLDFLRREIGADYDAFQSTVCNAHPLTQNGLNQLEKFLPKRDRIDEVGQALCIPNPQFVPLLPGAQVRNPTDSPKSTA